MIYKKGLSSVISISLFILITVFSISSLISWLNTQSSSSFVDFEEKKSGYETEIEEISRDKIYFKNAYSSLKIQDVKVEGESCNISKNLSQGLSRIDLSSCVESLTDTIAVVDIYTDKGIFSQTFTYANYEPPSYFISVWNTSILSWGSTNSDQIRLPLVSSGNYNFTVFWGDGSNDTVTHWNALGKTHTYDTPGEYEIKIEGVFEGFRFGDSGDRLKLLEIKNWGPLKIIGGGSFHGAVRLRITAEDVLDTRDVTDMSYMFGEASNITTIPRINEWDFSNVTNMRYMFFRASNFSQPLNFDTSRVTDMSAMFFRASNFNQSLDFDTSSVTDMINMFRDASSFNQPLNNWNVSNVEDMSLMFSGASNFNQPLSNWDVSNVEDMEEMFLDTNDFNQPLNSWNVSKVRIMEGMFDGASSFNQSLNNWSVSNVRDMSAMFSGADSFNQPLNNWSVFNVQDMSSMFTGADSFNQPLNNWNTSNVTNMMGMFSGTENFNGNISTWDVSNVEDMSTMFFVADSFNQSLNSWNMSNVINTEYMFAVASNFNQPLDNWDVSNVTDMELMFYSASSFYQNISSWCVDQFSDTYSTSFADGSPISGTDFEPVWGTCPE